MDIKERVAILFVVVINELEDSKWSLANTLTYQKHFCTVTPNTLYL